MPELNLTKDELRTRFLNWCRSEVGYVERPNNVTKYWTTLFNAGGTLGNYNLYNASWCAGFQVAGLYALGIKTWEASGLNPYFTPSMLNFAKKRGLTKKLGTAQPGDFYLYNFPGGNNVDHTGVAWPNPRTNTYRAIEGNTNYAGSANGGSVMVKERPAGQIVAVIDLIKWVEACGYTFLPEGSPVAPVVNVPTKDMQLAITGNMDAPTALALQKQLNAWARNGVELDEDGKLGLAMVKQLQWQIGAEQDGEFGRESARKLEVWLGKRGIILPATTIPGWYPGLVRGLQRTLLDEIA